MPQTSIFLTAEWHNLLMLNYAVDSAMLQPYVPAGTELDSFNGVTYLSLIGFEFNRTRVLGVTIPFHQDFEEVNVRFYVRRQDEKGIKRGVVFISELVPRRAIAAVARYAFNENYSRVPMAHRVERGAAGEVSRAQFSWRAGREACVMQIETEGPAYLPAEGSLPQFITEHYWGYAAQRNGGCLEYEVQHPQWLVWNAMRVSFTGNAVSVYGPQIAAILTRPPDSAFLAQGSPVTVSKGRRIV
jgi:hypothetical protein